MSTDYPGTVLPDDAQRSIEHYYGRKHIDRSIRNFFEIDRDAQLSIKIGVRLITDWLQRESPNKAKAERKEVVKTFDIETLVLEVLVGVAYCQREELFVSVVSQLASRLNFSTHTSGIQTVAEMLVVLATDLDAIRIRCYEKGGSFYVESGIKFPKELLDRIERSEYLPPMITTPERVYSNYESAYLTFDDCLILGRSTGHDEELCLDVVNTQNQVKLSLNMDVLKNVEEKPKEDFVDARQEQNWNQLLKTSQHFYGLMLHHGNEFYLTNKVDSRGRLYAQGYHISTQGSAFKKAIIELADKETIDVPEQYRI